VFGLLKTADGGSPSVSAAEVWTSMIAFTLLYGALAIIEVGLIVKYAKQGPPEDVVEEPYDSDAPSDQTLYFAY
jgi:cytochrome d ubiquinol oxidase subunit I